MSLVLRIHVRVFRTFSASRLAADRGDADDGAGVATGSAGSLADLEQQLQPMCGLRGSRGRCWYAYYPYRAEFGEEFSTVAISGVLEPGASDPQMRDFSGTEI